LRNRQSREQVVREYNNKLFDVEEDENEKEGDAHFLQPQIVAEIHQVEANVHQDNLDTILPAPSTFSDAEAEEIN